MRIRRAQHLDVQHTFHGRIKGVARCTPHNLWPRWRRQAATERGARDGIFDIGLANERIFDGAIAGATAQVAL